MRIFLLILAFLASAPALAGSINISPLGRVNTAQVNTDLLTLENRADTTARYQIRVFAWRQDGQDILEPTRQMFASPSMIEIPPGEKRVVRLKRQGGKAFRVIVSELPRPAVEGQVSVLIDYNLPFLFEPVGAPGPRLSATREGNTLVVSNAGGKAARLADVRAGDKEMGGLLGWVLPGSTMRFELEHFAPVLNLQVNSEPATLKVD